MFCSIVFQTASGRKTFSGSVFSTSHSGLTLPLEHSWLPRAAGLSNGRSSECDANPRVERGSGPAVFFGKP